MGWMTVPNQKYCPVRIVQKFFEDLADLIGRYAAFNHHEPHLSTRTDGGHHIQTEPCTGHFDYEHLVFGGPRPSNMKIRSDAAFIPKVIRGTNLFGSLFDLWLYGMFPLSYCLRMFLVGAKQRFLTAQAQQAKQLTSGGIAKCQFSRTSMTQI